MLSGAKACKSCRSRQELSNEYFNFTIYLQNSASIQPRTGLSKFAKNYPKVRITVGEKIIGRRSRRPRRRRARLLSPRPPRRMPSRWRRLGKASSPRRSWALLWRLSAARSRFLAPRPKTMFFLTPSQNGFCSNSNFFLTVSNSWKIIFWKIDNLRCEISGNLRIYFSI